MLGARLRLRFYDPVEVVSGLLMRGTSLVTLEYTDARHTAEH